MVRWLLVPRDACSPTMWAMQDHHLICSRNWPQERSRTFQHRQEIRSYVLPQVLMKGSIWTNSKTVLVKYVRKGWEECPENVWNCPLCVQYSWGLLHIKPDTHFLFYTFIFMLKKSSRSKHARETLYRWATCPHLVPHCFCNSINT